MAIERGLQDRGNLGGRQRPVGQFLKDMELVTESDIQKALIAQVQEYKPIGEILFRMGCVSHEGVLVALAPQMGLQDYQIIRQASDGPK